MLTAHDWVAYAVIAVCGPCGGVGRSDLPPARGGGGDARPRARTRADGVRRAGRARPAAARRDGRRTRATTSTTSTARSRCSSSWRPGSTRRRTRAAGWRGSRAPRSSPPRLPSEPGRPRADEALLGQHEPDGPRLPRDRRDRAHGGRAEPLQRARLARDPRADRVPARDHVLRLPRLARAARGDLGLADAGANRALRRRDPDRLRPARLQLLGCERPRRGRVPARARDLRLRGIPRRGAASTPTGTRRYASTRAQRRRERSSAARISMPSPTKIGVSRSV